MVEYAIIGSNDTIIEYRNYEIELLDSQIKKVDGKPMARKVIEATKPSYISDIETIVKSDVVANTVVNRSWTVTAKELEPIKLIYTEKVDADAEDIRRLFITPGAGQAMTYLQKNQEAQAYLKLVNDGGTPVANNFPMLQAAVGVDAEDMHGVAQVVESKYQMWLTIGAMIENVRLSAKRDIEAANTVYDVYDIYTAIEWPSAS